jgi:hypothetical protein
MGRLQVLLNILLLLINFTAGSPLLPLTLNCVLRVVLLDPRGLTRLHCAVSRVCSPDFTYWDRGFERRSGWSRCGLPEPDTLLDNALALPFFKLSTIWTEFVTLSSVLLSIFHSVAPHMIIQSFSAATFADRKRQKGSYTSSFKACC